MKTHQFRILTFSCFLLGLVSPGGAATNGLEAQLKTPQLQSLQASIAAPSNNVAVQITFLYNTKGQLSCSADSTIDGLPATGTGTETKRGSNITYTLTLKATSSPPTVIVLSGTVGSNVARCTYQGPKGRATITAQPITLASATPVPLHIGLTSGVSSRNGISGQGNIVAFGTNGPTPGRLNGTVSSNSLSWTLSQPPRSLIFKGTRSNDLYAGSLKVTAPPARETVAPFGVPVSAFPMQAGVATFRGAVLLASNSMPVAAAGAHITVKCDRNGDGKFTGTEKAVVVADAQGRYRIPFSVQLGRAVLLEVTFPGYARHLASYPEVSPGASVTRNATLPVLGGLAIDHGTAQSGDGKITLSGLPAAITSVEARVFNPVTETAQFPGPFRDSESNLLISSVFTAIEAKNNTGAAVTNLGTNAILCLAVPRDTWPTLRDLQPGNGQIDIPLYYYDEATGEWRRNSTGGWLEDTNHAKIAEAQLASIRDGSFSGLVCAVGPITHLSYWNIDWPVDTHTTIGGVIVDIGGTPVGGAVLTVRGVTYTGSSAPHVTTASGAFCADIMRSEGAGEDVDGDGITNETQQVQITVQNGTNYYSFGPFNSPQAQATCETGGGLSLGLITLAESNRLAVSTCIITGRMVFSGTSIGGTQALNPGDPIASAPVFGYDPEAGELTDLGPCTNILCNSAVTDADGYFALAVPMLSGVTLYGARVDTAGASGLDTYSGTTSFMGCPPGLITLNADFTAIRFLLLELSGTGLDSGTLLIQNNQPIILLSTGSAFYITRSTANVAPPSSTGVWLTLSLVKAGIGFPAAGTITFTVNSLSPVSGTWTTSTLGLSGTFTE